MARRVLRTAIEIYDHQPEDHHDELPEDWDTMSPAERNDYLTELGGQYLFEAANYATQVVEIDDAGNEKIIE